MEHDSTPNKELLVEQYYKEGTHDALVSRDVYEDANRVMMMRDLKRGPDQYPYYGRLVCPYCGKPMVKVNIGHGKYPAGWVCGGDCKGELYEERTDCPIYCVKNGNRKVVRGMIHAHFYARVYHREHPFYYGVQAAAVAGYCFL